MSCLWESVHLMNELCTSRRYESITIELDEPIYKEASMALQAIGSSVEEFSALCLLKMVRYVRDIPSCSTMQPDELIRRIVDDVTEELELCYVNKPTTKRE